MNSVEKLCSGSLPTWAAQTRDRLLSGNIQPTDRYWADPALVMSEAGFAPDPWQAALMRGRWRRAMLCCSRQSGKTTVAAALAVQTALLRPSLVLLLSPGERQSGELAQRVLQVYDALGKPVRARKRTELQLHLANGSRILALPGNEATVRCYSSVSLLVIDEAARVPDDLYSAIRPMLIVSRGRLLVMSTPFGKRGWFHKEWQEGANWQRVKITADQCPRVTPQDLADERATLGERWYRQEYFCSFEETIDSVFSQEDIDAAFAGQARPFDLEGA